MDIKQQIKLEITTHFYRTIKEMQVSLDRRADHVSIFEPAANVNYSDMFAGLSQDITVEDLYTELAEYEKTYGKVVL